MWERWEMVESYEGYSKMASFNHAMTGAVGVCFHKYLAGIRADENEPGFQNAIIRPVIPRKLRHVEGKVESIHGNFKCRWEFESDNRLKMAVQIPFNCTADIYLPVGWCSQAMVMTCLLYTSETVCWQFLCQSVSVIGLIISRCIKCIINHERIIRFVQKAKKPLT